MARDSSAYYIAEWRLFHSPATIYFAGSQPGNYQIIGITRTFKYTPSFLIFFATFLTLSYQNALNTFDIVQFASILLLPFFIYKIVKNKNIVLGSIASIIV